MPPEASASFPDSAILDRSSGYSISEVAAGLGLTPRALRYYEEVGLVTPKRSRLNTRIYAGQALENLEAIALLRRAGVDVETITWVLGTEDRTTRTARMKIAGERRLQALAAQTLALHALMDRN